MDMEDKYLKACDLLNRGKFEEAINNFKEILNKNLSHYQSINKMGVALAKQGRIDEAMEMFSRCIIINPDFAPALVNIGNVYKQKHDDSNALKYYYSALEKKNDYYLAYYNIAAVFKSVGNYDEYFKNIKKYKKFYKEYINNKEKLEASRINRNSIYFSALGILIISILLLWGSRGI